MPERFFSHAPSMAEGTGTSRAMQSCCSLSGFVSAALGQGWGCSWITNCGCSWMQGTCEGSCKKLSLQVQVFIRRKQLWEGAAPHCLELLWLWSRGRDGGWSAAVVLGAPWLCARGSPQQALPGFCCTSAIAPALQFTAYPWK